MNLFILINVKKRVPSQDEIKEAEKYEDKIQGYNRFWDGNYISDIEGNNYIQYKEEVIPDATPFISGKLNNYKDEEEEYDDEEL